MKNYFMIDGKKIPMSEETAKSIIEANHPEPNSYKDICRELFKKGVKASYITSNLMSNIKEVVSSVFVTKPSNWNNGNESLSPVQLESLIARNKLINTAKYFNSLSVDSGNKHYIAVGIAIGLIHTINYRSDGNHAHTGVVLFNKKEDAEKAIDILGTEIIQLALMSHK
jgi:hypothetical protein